MIRIAAWSAGVWLVAAGAASADVQLSIADGRVTLIARDATVRQILDEWARVGQTRVVNGERVSGGPVTLELHQVPEAQALDTILRTVAGYMAAPRGVPVASASQFDRIIVMPTSVAPPAPRAAAAPAPMFPQPQPVFQQPGPPGQYPMPATPRSEDENDEPVRGPVYNGFPQSPVMSPPNPTVGPAQGPLVLPQPGGNAQPIGGVSTPGMIVQPPQPQGQPVIPGQPRRPSGPGGARDH